MIGEAKKENRETSSSKIGSEAVYRLCAVEKCDMVVTDNGVKPADVARLRKLTTVLVAQ